MSIRRKCERTAGLARYETDVRAWISVCVSKCCSRVVVYSLPKFTKRFRGILPGQSSLMSPDDVDGEVRGWLQRAYDQNH